MTTTNLKHLPAQLRSELYILKTVTVPDLAVVRSQAARVHRNIRPTHPEAPAALTAYEEADQRYQAALERLGQLGRALYCYDTGLSA